MRRLLTATAACLLTAATLGAQDQLSAQEHRDSRQHYRNGEELMSQELFQKAAAEFRMAARIDPSYTMAYYSLGQASMVLKRYDDAAGAYEACRETIQALSSTNVKTRGEARQERVDELREIEAALERWGGTDAPPRGETIRLEERRRLLEQQEDRDSIQNVKIPPELSLSLGSAYFRLGRREDATREYRQAIEAGDETGAAHNNLAVILMMDDRLDEAKAHLILAEEAGFRINPRFKQDLTKRAASVEQ